MYGPPLPPGPPPPPPPPPPPDSPPASPSPPPNDIETPADPLGNHHDDAVVENEVEMCEEDEATTQPEKVPDDVSQEPTTDQPETLDNVLTELKAIAAQIEASAEKLSRIKERQKVSKSCQTELLISQPKQESSHSSGNEISPLKTANYPSAWPPSSDVAVTAQTAAQFHYDEATGSIFDQQLGAYYFPEQRLYFDPRFSAYYVFDEATKAFVFHSQPGRGPTVTDTDGSDYELVRSADDIRRLSAMRDEFRDPSAAYPPCLRLILTRPGLGCRNRRGQLFIVPSCVESALIGTSDSADIRLEFDRELADDDETTLATIHARIGYFNGEYSVQSCLMDGGGVWVDDRDIGQLAMPLTHDCTLKCADSELLVHQHLGNTTCVRCEPAFYAVHVAEPPPHLAATALAIKRRYGLLRHQQGNVRSTPVASKYKDRAGQRRRLYQQGKSAAGKTTLRMGWRVGRGLRKSRKEDVSSEQMEASGAILADQT